MIVKLHKEIRNSTVWCLNGHRSKSVKPDNVQSACNLTSTKISPLYSAVHMSVFQTLKHLNTSNPLSNMLVQVWRFELLLQTQAIKHLAVNELLCMPKFFRVKCEAVCLTDKASSKLGHAAG